MIHVFKRITVIIIYCSIFSFSSKVFAEDYFKDISQSITEEKMKCLKSKSNNFRDYPAKDRIILLYLNSILDKLLDSNKAILDDFKRYKSEFCILLDSQSFIQRSTGFQSSTNGLIKIGLNENFLLYIPSRTDADIVAQLSHEIAHDLLNHSEKKYKMLMKIKEAYFEQLSSKNGISNFTKYALTYPEYIELLRQHEIEADNLGFQIYLHSGFRFSDYGDFFLKIEVNRTHNNRTNSSKKVEEFNSLKKLLQDDQIDLEMNSINMKYHNPDQDLHPSGYWRAWNIYKQENELLQNSDINIDTTNTDNQVLDMVFIRIDLSKSKRLENIKNFFNGNRSSVPVNYKDINDPRTYIMYELFKDNSEISYHIELDPKYQGSIGRLQDNNFIILKAIDIFNVSILMDFIKYQEYISQCIQLFRES